MQQNIEFERCIDFLVRMIDKYGEEDVYKRQKLIVPYGLIIKAKIKTQRTSLMYQSRRCV